MKNLTLILLIAISINSFAQKTDYNTLVDKGLTELKQQNSETAVSYYKQALKLDTTRVEAIYGLGVAYLSNGNQYLKALYYLNKAIAIDNTYRNGYYNRARCKGYLEDYSGSINDFNKAIEKNSKDADMYFGRAMMKIKIKDKDGACADFKKSAELGSKTAKQMFELNCQLGN